MLETFALFYGIVGTTATFIPYFKKIKSWLSTEAKHERIIFKCYEKALKDVRGEDLSRFRLKGDVAVLKQIDGFFEKDDLRTASTYIDKFLCSLNIDLLAVRKRFEHHLAEAGSPEVLTYISLRTLNGTKRVERKLSELPDRLVEILSPKAPALPKDIPLAPAPYFAHPYPLQKNFTGRDAERKQLAEWFTKGEHPMFAYVAMGGMGKSALTWYWLQEDIIKRGLVPEGIIWWSFYDREASFDSFLTKAIQYASKGEIDAKAITSAREKMDTLYPLLCKSRFLLVLDGVERVLRAYAGLGSPYQGDEVKEDERQDFRACVDPNVGYFLQWLASGKPKTKTLLTTRLCPRELDSIDGCCAVGLKELSKQDGVEFFRRQGVKGTRAEIERACDPFGYHPLCLRLLSGMIVEDPQCGSDVNAWTKHNPLPDLKGEKKEHHILELAYNALGGKKQALVSKLSAFRNPMAYDALAILNEFKGEGEFDKALIDLVDRGLLLKEAYGNMYDLHPIVRKYCYDRLKGKKGVHSQLRNYFASVPEPEKVESLDDLTPVIELYHHTVNSGEYDEAYSLLVNRLVPDPLHFRLGAYQLMIELEGALFDDDEYRICKLRGDSKQAWLYNSLATSYSLSGQSNKAVPLFEKANDIFENVIKNKEYLATGLGNLAETTQIPLGELREGECNLRRRISLCQEIKDEFGEAVGRRQLGRLLLYQGRFEESEKQLASAIDLFIKEHRPQPQGLVWAFRALRALLMSDCEEALKAAEKAGQLAHVECYEIDAMRAGFFLGAAHLARGDLEQAEEHLNEALVRDRRINLVEFEPDILLEFAKLRFAKGRKEEALELANEALGIADRCQYRLKQADIHNFLAGFYLDTQDFAKAKEHMEIAKERAACGYKPAMDKAEVLAKRIEQKP